jgi:uncharacterized membrane protein YhhN
LSLLALLYSIVRDWRAGRFWLKVLCSLGFILLALSLRPNASYDWLILAGLVLAAVGDVALLYRSKRAFLFGLIAFLMGHVLYAVAFAWIGQPVVWMALLLLGVSGGFLAWFWPHVQGWRLPVVAYVLVISLMLWLALGVNRLEVWLGALSFYLSDIFVARERFMASGAINPLIGLPLYYLGQYLLALSV